MSHFSPKSNDPEIDNLPTPRWPLGQLTVIEKPSVSEIVSSKPTSMLTEASNISKNPADKLADDDTLLVLEWLDETVYVLPLGLGPKTLTRPPYGFLTLLDFTKSSKLSSYGAQSVSWKEFLSCFDLCTHRIRGTFLTFRDVMRKVTSMLPFRFRRLSPHQGLVHRYDRLNITAACPTGVVWIGLGADCHLAVASHRPCRSALPTG